MQIKMYRKKNGDVMIFLNGRTSVGLSGPYAPHGKGMTKAKRRLVDELRNLFECHAFEFTGDLSNHHEGPVYQVGPYKLVITDVAEVGGQSVISDGAYLIRHNKIANIGALNGAKDL